MFAVRKKDLRVMAAYIGSRFGPLRQYLLASLPARFIVLAAITFWISQK